MRFSGDSNVRRIRGKWFWNWLKIRKLTIRWYKYKVVVIHKTFLFHVSIVLEWISNGMNEMTNDKQMAF